MSKEIWQKSRVELFRDLDCGEGGLTSSQAAERQARYGLNELQEGSKKSTLRIFLEQFADFIVIILILAAIAAFVLKKTPFGWHILAIGGNEKAARLSGIKVEKNTIMVYAISGACSALIGLVTMAQIAASHPNTGDSWEMNAIAAVVLGGTSMAGGVGTIGGTVIGAFVIGIINDGMTMCGVSEFWQKVIRGLVIILAVLIDQFQRNLQAKMALQARNESK